MFDKGADPEQVSVKFTPSSVSLKRYNIPFLYSSLLQLHYENGEKRLVLEPLTGEIDPEASNYTVGKVKVEVGETYELD